MQLNKVDQEAQWLINLFQECVDYIEALISIGVAENPKSRSLIYWRRRAGLVHVELTDIRRQLVKRTPDVIASAYTYGHDIAHVEPDNGYNGTLASKNFGSAVNSRAIAILSANLNNSLDDSLITVGRRVDDAFRKAGLRAAAYHAVAGTDHRMAAQQMEAMLKRDSIRAFTDKAGREWSLSAYTSMAIRTVTREAVTQGTYQGLTQNGHNLYQVSHHVHSCDICAEYDGRTFSTSDAPAAIKAQYPTSPGDKLPPIHPNCKHVIAPATVSFDQIEAELLAKYGGVTAHA